MQALILIYKYANCFKLEQQKVRLETTFLPLNSYQYNFIFWEVL